MSRAKLARRRVAPLLFSAVAVTASPALAATRTWDNEFGNSNWSNVTNWSSNTKPTITDDAVFPNSFPSSIIFAFPENAQSVTLNGSYNLGFGTLNLGGTGVFSVASLFTGTVTTALGGSAGLTKQGGGTLILGTNNNFTGPINVNSGVLQIDQDSRLGSNAANDVTINGGMLETHGTTTALATRSFTLADANSAISVLLGTTFTIPTTVSGPGGLSKHGLGTLALSGTNSYAGDTWIGLGTLQLQSAASIPSTTSVTIQSGTFDVNNVSPTIAGLSGSGATLLGSGTLNVATSASSTYSGTISGTGGLTKSGSGTLRLNQVSSYSGGTTIDGGVLAVSADQHLGNGGGVTFYDGDLRVLSSFSTARTIGAAVGGIHNGVSIDVAASQTLTHTGPLAVGIYGLTKKGTGTLVLAGNSPSGSSTLSILGGVVKLGADDAYPVDGHMQGGTFDMAGFDQTIRTIGAMTVTNSAGGLSTLTLTGPAGADFLNAVITGNTAVDFATPSLLRLETHHTYTGATTISAGTIRNNVNIALPTTTALTVASGATYELDGWLQTIGSLAGSGSVSLGSSTLTTSANNTTFAGVISGTGGVRLFGVGATTLTLTGASTYTGETFVDQGVLQITASNNLAANAPLKVDAGGTLSVNNTTLPQNVTLDWGGHIEGVGNATVTGAITLLPGVTANLASGLNAGDVLTIGDSANDLTGGSGTSNIQVGGFGKVVLAQGSNYLGNWLINSFASLQHNDALGTGTSAVNLGFVLELTTGVTLSRDLTTLGGGVLRSAGNAALNGNYTGAQKTIEVVPGATLTITGSVSGTNTTTKTGGGVLTSNPPAAVSGFNTGSLAVNAGTVKTLGTQASVLNTVSVNTGAGGELDLNNGGLILKADNLPNVRALVLAGAGGVGFAAQTWDQPGINSSSAAADPLTYAVGYLDNDNFILGAKATFDGVTVPPASILVKSTLAGDADLDWDVDDDDVTVLGIFYGAPGNTYDWFEADFDYTGHVDDDDVTIIGITYGQTLPSAPAGVASVPEPACLSLAALAMIATGRGISRRRRVR